MHDMDNRLPEELRLQVHDLLTKVFGDPKPSRYLSDKRRGRSNISYYFHLKNPQAPEDLLAYLQSRYPPGGEFPFEGMRYPLEERWEKPTWREVYTQVIEENDNIRIRFFTMDGIRFHRSYGNRVAASLYSAKEPIFALQIFSSGLISTLTGRAFDTLKFTWWVNRVMRENLTIRTIMIGILQIIGKNMPIMRDVARTVETDGFFLPPLDMTEMLTCHTPAELIEKAAGGKLDINYNKTDLNSGYYLTCFRSRFDEQVGIRLRDYPRDSLHIENADLYEGPTIQRFLTAHYYYMTNGLEKWEIRTAVRDYLAMCEDHGILPQILPTYQAFLRKHDELAEAYSSEKKLSENGQELVVPDSRFEILSRFLRLIGESGLEWIKTAERLYREGEEQHNCVYSYRRRIRNDECAIFHLNRSGESYTIQVEKNTRGRFIIAQMLSRFNNPCRPEDKQYVEGLLRRINSPTLKDEEILRSLRYGIPMQPSFDPANDSDLFPTDDYIPWESGETDEWRTDNID